MQFADHIMCHSLLQDFIEHTSISKIVRTMPNTPATVTEGVSAEVKEGGSQRPCLVILCNPASPSFNHTDDRMVCLT